MGAVLIDKEISESSNYMKLSAKMKGRTIDAKMLRVLFESRIKQRLALQVPQETVEQIKHNFQKKQKANNETNPTTVVDEKKEVDKSTKEDSKQQGNPRKTIMDIVKNAGNLEPEDTTFHHEIIN